MTEGPIHRIRRWFKLHVGRGRAMREAGARVTICPLCSRDTPAYETEYDESGEPLAFSVCVWCEGYIEWPTSSDRPQVAYGVREEDPRSRNR